MGFLWLAEPARSQVPPAPLLQIQLAGSQQLLLELSGATGRIYQVEISSNLLDWVPALTTNSVSSNVVATVGGPGGWASGFYRVVDLGPAPGSASPSAEFTLLWPAAAAKLAPRKLGLTPAGSVVFAVQNASGKTVTNQVVNLSTNANQATVVFTNLANGSYTLVADAYPQANGVGVPFEEARLSFSVTGGAPVTQTFTLADNTITTIIIAPQNATVAIAGTLQLNATAYDASNEVVFVASQSGALTWSSVDTAVATVDYTGKATGVALGSDTIQVAEAADPAITTNIQVTVSNEIVGLTLTPSEVDVGVGQETNLTLTATNANGDKVPLAASAVTWTSSAVTNAIVDGLGAAGLLIGVAPGSATITLTIKNMPNLPSPITLANVTIGGPGSGADGVPPPTNGYIITDLGALPPNLSSLPSAINDYGHIVGTTWNSLSPNNDTTAPQAYIWKTSLNSVMTVLPDLGGGQAEATGINSSDEVVGWSIKAVTLASPKQYSHAVLWRSISKATDLNGELPTPTSPPWPAPDPPEYYSSPNLSYALSINNEDQVIGYATDETTNSIQWGSEFLLGLDQTNLTYLWASLFSAQLPPRPEAETINDAGEMTGGQFVYNGVYYFFAYAFVGQAGQVTSNNIAPLSNLPGCQSGIAAGINNLNQVAGQCSQSASDVTAFAQPRAVAWQDGAANLDGTGQATDLGTNGYLSRALFINDLGTVVGDSWPSGGVEFTNSRAVLWQGANMYDLNSFIPTNSGWVLDVATAINNKGQIVGQGTRSNELGYRSFLLTTNN